MVMNRDKTLCIKNVLLFNNLVHIEVILLRKIRLREYECVCEILINNIVKQKERIWFPQTQPRVLRGPWLQDFSPSAPSPPHF